MVGDICENFEQKWLCVFLIDLSMGHDSLVKLDKDLHDFHRLIMEDATSRDHFELCVATFGHGFKVLQEPASVERFTMPALDSYDNEALANAVNDIVDRIAARECWYKNTGQKFYRPCLVLVTCEADEKVLHCDELKHLNAEIQKQRFDFLMVGMDGSSVYAHSSGIEIKMNDDRSLAQMLYPIWGITKWGDYACEMPLSDSPITGLTEPPPDDAWMDSFEN